MQRRTSWWQCALGRLAACAAALLLCGASLAGDHLLTLDPAAGEAALGSSGEAFIDASGEAVVETIATDSGIPWSITRPGAIYPLRTGAALWFRFTLAEPDDSERWYLEVPYPAVNLVTLYAADREGNWTSQSAGDKLPVAAWPLPHRHPVLPVLLSPGAPQQFYVRVENPHSFSAPLLFTSERQLVRQEQRASLILGMYFGLAGLAVLLAVLAGGSLRDSTFGWYALIVLLMGLTQASMTGVAGLHLWPNLPRWNDASAMVLPLAAVSGLLWFFSAVVSLRQRSRRLHRWLAAVSVICLLGAAANLVVDPVWRVRLLAPGIIIAIGAGVSALIWALRRGDRHAGWLLAGMTPVLAGSAFPLARAAGLIPVSFWTTHAMQIGIAIELPVLLAVLIARSQDRRENIRRLHGLPRTDPATGLVNGEVFEERLERLISRSERLKHQSVVLLIDIANVDQIRRDFDRRSAEEMPLRVAGRLLSAAREIDSVARVSDHRFGMLVEGPLTADEAAAVGPKVVARCLMPFEGKPVEWVAQVRVAQTMVPCGVDAPTVIDRLEAVLAGVPANSKRAVFTIK
ncbi:MAG: sensor histidine kinase [uncultured Ramlibacter sp.]|uniref:Sensor histidine kinase n=1 Tax=uncultured Ramlibacter sp. TaxID=260755 RepID=A0A6J4NJU5_9BURK|nr:MAG: sensor histidine kinase [uncultured Ramlibacter sp.]